MLHLRQATTPLNEFWLVNSDGSETLKTEDLPPMHQISMTIGHGKVTQCIVAPFAHDKSLAFSGLIRCMASGNPY